MLRRKVSKWAKVFGTGLVLMVSLPMMAGTLQADQLVGVVYPLQDIALSMSVTGIVKLVDAKPGEKVRMGQELLSLNDGAQQIETRRRQVIWENNAELLSLEERLKRMQELVRDQRSLYEESGAVSRDDLYRLELEYLRLRGRRDQLVADKEREHQEYLAARHELEVRRLKAPIGGIVTRIDVEIGEWVGSGAVVMQLVDISSCVLHLAVPVAATRKLKSGLRVPVAIEGRPAGQTIQGEVTFLSPVADPASGLVKAEVTFPNPGISVRAGIKGYIVFEGAEKE